MISFTNIGIGDTGNYARRTPKRSTIKSKTSSIPDFQLRIARSSPKVSPLPATYQLLIGTDFRLWLPLIEQEGISNP